MIFYFSGTGNSKWIAQEVAKGTEYVAVNIVDLLKTGENQISVKKKNIRSTYGKNVRIEI